MELARIIVFRSKQLGKRHNVGVCVCVCTSQHFCNPVTAARSLNVLGIGAIDRF